MDRDGDGNGGPVDAVGGKSLFGLLITTIASGIFIRRSDLALVEFYREADVVIGAFGGLLVAGAIMILWVRSIEHWG